jgi:hypothetical protein
MFANGSVSTDKDHLRPRAPRLALDRALIPYRIEGGGRWALAARLPVRVPLAVVPFVIMVVALLPAARLVIISSTFAGIVAVCPDVSMMVPSVVAADPHVSAPR